MQSSFKYIGVVALLFIGLSCSRHNGPALDTETCASIYAELMENTMRVPTLGDSTLAADNREIFSKFRTTEVAFTTTLQSYSSNVAKWKDLFEEVVRRLEDQSRVKEKRAKP